VAVPLGITELRNSAALEGHKWSTLVREVKLTCSSKSSEYRNHVDDVLKVGLGIWNIWNVLAEVDEAVNKDVTSKTNIRVNVSRCIENNLRTNRRDKHCRPGLLNLVVSFITKIRKHLKLHFA
jgi:hypothetical protein